MTEQLFLAAFIFIFGAQVGRVLTLHQQYRKTVEGITCLLNAEWLPPQSMAAQLVHEDQDSTGDLPEPTRVYGWAPSKRQPFWLDRQYEFRRWRAPRLRRAA